MTSTISPRGNAKLGAELGRGGEGGVFEIPACPQYVAKIYHSLPSPERVAKLEAMINRRNEQLSRFTAWPVQLIQDHAGSPIRGFVMPRITAHHAIHELYSPKSRRTAFPDIDFGFLVHAAMNLSRAFEHVHANNCVIGDVNFANALVSDSAMIKLIDCDSFQISDAGHKIFRCEVGESTFVPPELQGIDLGTIDRTVNHDAFGLAILIFHLLFQGRHPFAGRYHGQGEMSMERAISEGHFAYSRRARSMLMTAPPHSLRLDDLTDDLAELFERAFATKSAQNNKRPLPAEWSSALEKLARTLVRCTASSAHRYVNERSACPWCSIESGTGVVLFQDPIALWEVVNKIDIRSTSTLVDIHCRPRPSASNSAIRAKFDMRFVQGIVVFVVLISTLDIVIGWYHALMMVPIVLAADMAIGIIIRENARLILDRESFRRRATSTMQRYETLERRWNDQSDIVHIDQEKKNIERIVKDLAPENRKRIGARRGQLEAELRLKSQKLLIDATGVKKRRELLYDQLNTAAELALIAEENSKFVPDWNDLWSEVGMVVIVGVCVIASIGVIIGGYWLVVAGPWIASNLLTGGFWLISHMLTGILWVASHLLIVMLWIVSGLLAGILSTACAVVLGIFIIGPVAGLVLTIKHFVDDDSNIFILAGGLFIVGIVGGISSIILRAEFGGAQVGWYIFSGIVSFFNNTSAIFETISWWR